MLRRHQYYKPKQRHRVLRAPDRKSGHVREDGRARAAGIARAIVGFIFFGAVLLWFAYFFLFSGSFEIKDIRIIGNKNIPTAELLGIIRSELSRKRWGVVPSRSSLLVPTDAVADAIRSRYIVDDISVRRRLPFAISVALEEKLSRVVLRVKTPVEIINAETALLPEEGTEGDAASSTESQEVSHNNVTGAPKPEGAGEVSFAESLYYLDVNGIVVAAL
ncbi:MAG: FtsQ-type POTRA domain-containing protein, partial [Parcubacteria group bacterium]|nr:FtsQ-type POTRA domain-containing protein [Parcubacteria group bacterium]